MTLFIKEDITPNQPHTTSRTSKTAPRPMQKTTVGATREAAGPHTRFEALDMEGEDEYLEIRPFTIKPGKAMAITHNRDYSTAFNALNNEDEEDVPALKPTADNPSENTTTTQKQGKPTKVVHWNHLSAPRKSRPEAMDATIPKAPRAIPHDCTSVIKIHAAKPFKRDDWDLPEMIQHFQARIDDIAAQGRCLPNHLVTLLDRFYTIHGTVGIFDVRAKPETSVGEDMDVIARSAADKAIITIRRLYPYNGVPDAEKLPLRPERKASNVNIDTAGSFVLRGGSKHGDKDAAAEMENGKTPNDRPASRARVTQEALRLAFARLPSGW